MGENSQILNGTPSKQEDLGRTPHQQTGNLLPRQDVRNCLETSRPALGLAGTETP